MNKITKEQAKKPSNAQVDEVIKTIRESDNFLTPIFLNGGCYQFGKILKSIYPQATLLEIPSKHAVALINGKYYDITGEVDFKEWNCTIKDLIEPTQRMINANFSNNKYFYRECPNCEDLVAFTSDIFIEQQPHTPSTPTEEDLDIMQIANSSILLYNYDEEVKYWELYSLNECDDFCTMIVLDDRDDTFHYIIYNDYQDNIEYDMVIAKSIAIKIISGANALSHTQSTHTVEGIKEVLSKPYKVVYDYEKGFLVQLYGLTVYTSNRFANEFDNSEHSRSEILLEYAKHYESVEFKEEIE